MDECGNEATLQQTVTYDDRTAPALQGSVPENLVLSCSEAMPAASDLLFSDNCEADMSVPPTEVKKGGGICAGDVTTRTWVAPADSCGNQGPKLVQTITVLDQSPPQLPTTLADVVMICPNDYKMENLLVPEATDDCCTKDEITVTPTGTEPNGCEDIMITWTATDQCGKMTTTDQVVSSKGERQLLMKTFRFANIHFAGQIQ